MYPHKNNSLLTVAESDLNALKNSQPIGYPLKYMPRNRVNLALKAIKFLGYLNSFATLRKINNLVRGKLLHNIIISRIGSFKE